MAGSHSSGENTAPSRINSVLSIWFQCCYCSMWLPSEQALDNHKNLQCHVVLLAKQFAISWIREQQNRMARAEFLHLVRAPFPSDASPNRGLVQTVPGRDCYCMHHPSCLRPGTPPVTVDYITPMERTKAHPLADVEEDDSMNREYLDLEIKLGI